MNFCSFFHSLSLSLFSLYFCHFASRTDNDDQLHTSQAISSPWRRYPWSVAIIVDRKQLEQNHARGNLIARYHHHHHHNLYLFSISLCRCVLFLSLSLSLQRNVDVVNQQLIHWFVLSMDLLSVFLSHFYSPHFSFSSLNLFSTNSQLIVFRVDIWQNDIRVFELTLLFLSSLLFNKQTSINIQTYRNAW